MMDDRNQLPLALPLRVARFIVGVMIAGLLVLTAALIATRTAAHQPPEPGMITYAALAIAGFLILLHRAVPALLTWQLGRQFSQAARILSACESVTASDLRHQAAVEKFRQLLTSQALGQYVLAARVVVMASILEGAGMLSVVAYWLEGSLACLAVTALAVSLLVFAFPTRAQADQWNERFQPQTEALRAELARPVAADTAGN